MSSCIQKELSVLVLQNGARHNYAVPLALAKHNSLIGFYTDFAGNQGLGRIFSPLRFLAGKNSKLNRLYHRKIPDEVLPFTATFPLSSFIDSFINRHYHDYVNEPLLGMVMECLTRVSPPMIYSSMTWSATFLQRAKSLGSTIVSEFYLNPTLWKVHQEEYRLFSEWETTFPYADIIENNFHRIHPHHIADFLIVPTVNTKRDVVTNCNYPEDRIFVVPYGVGNTFFEISNHPEQGNVIFVGSCSLAKGFHYFAKAVHALQNNHKDLNLRIIAAGDVTEKVRRQTECSGIQFLGRVPRHEIFKLYQTADILVFPTLSDSFGAVMLEAMAAGIPVISSPYCADVNVHGETGYVVDPREVESLTNAIASIVGNRALRQKMAGAARLRAQQYTWLDHGKLLIQTLSEIQQRVAS